MDRLLTAWKTLPTPTKAIAVGCVLALLLVVGGAVGGFVSHWKDARFDKQEAEREQQRQALETEREQAIGRATAAEARAAELESRTRILEVTVDAFGKRAEQIKGVITDEEKKMADEIGGIDNDIDAFERCQRICTRLKNLGYLAKDKECNCR